MTKAVVRRVRGLAILLAATLAVPSLPAAHLTGTTPDGAPGGVSPFSSPAIAPVPVAPTFVGFGGDGPDVSDGPLRSAPRTVSTESAGRNSNAAGRITAARAANLGYRARAAHHMSIRTAHLVAPPTAPPTSTV